MVTIKIGDDEVFVSGYSIESPTMSRQSVNTMRHVFLSPFGPSGADPNPEATLAKRILDKTPSAQITGTTGQQPKPEKGAVI